MNLSRKTIPFWMKNTGFIPEKVVKPSYLAPLSMNKNCKAVSYPLTSFITGKCWMSRHLTVTVISASHLLNFLLAFTLQITLFHHLSTGYYAEFVSSLILAFPETRSWVFHLSCRSALPLLWNSLFWAKLDSEIQLSVNELVMLA